MRAVSLLCPGRSEPQQQPPQPPIALNDGNNYDYDEDYDEEYDEEYDENEGGQYIRSLDPQLALDPYEIERREDTGRLTPVLVSAMFPAASSNHSQRAVCSAVPYACSAVQ